MCRDSVMARSLVDSERCESVKKRVYLPGVDEFRSSSGPLSGKLAVCISIYWLFRTKFNSL